MGDFLLRAYGLAWGAALPPLRLAAALDRIMRVTLGAGFVPARWEASGRLSEGAARGNLQDTVWLHGASLGEAKGLWALTEKLPGRLVLTANTAEGLAFLRERSRAREDVSVAVAPFDHPALVQAFIDRHGVGSLCLYEIEWWPHFILACARRGIPVLLVAARCPARLRGRRFWSRVLGEVSWIQARGDDDASRFRALTSAPVEIGFDFKAAYFLKRSLPRAARRDRFAFLSLHAAELDFFLPVLPRLMNRHPIAVFPRHLAELARFRAALAPLGFILHSQSPSARHLLVDAYGKVAELLPDCHSVFVGGSLVKAGCHNLWEPLMAGLAIHHGPNVEAQEPLAGRLARKGLAATVTRAEEAESWEAPEPGRAEACARFVEDLKQALEESLERCVLRLARAGRPQATQARAAAVD